MSALSGESSPFDVHSLYAVGFPFCDRLTEIGRLFQRPINSIILIFKRGRNHGRLIGGRARMGCAQNRENLCDSKKNVIFQNRFFFSSRSQSGILRQLDVCHFLQSANFIRHTQCARQKQSGCGTIGSVGAVQHLECFLTVYTSPVKRLVHDPKWMLHPFSLGCVIHRLEVLLFLFIGFAFFFRVLILLINVLQYLLSYLESFRFLLPHLGIPDSSST